ncbi:hypothetical protein FGD67_04835 [Colwellia sp. M166]|uniref:hypothetical protein n=1 Tax=Colwellia sp. M166 TaxID=2583805 RepID=UPI00211E13F3|nr:hypothetical protein [Colwellia sp. M166]UUO22584.1 hypothetical protein FGD67_04835 [Colwellia sp. M166]|tara:strand:- start:6964 stop:8634 length:1671 start_codon:yes stop_codon:yes gene_type:complete
MNIKTLFKVSVIASAMALVGCGGDIKIEPTVNDNSVDNSTNNSNNTDGGIDTGTTNLCAIRGELQGAYDGRDCNYPAAFASKNIEIETDLTFAELPNDGVHVFTGALLMGKDCDSTTGCTVNTDGPTLTVEAGANLAFTSGEAIIRIGRGAKINAVGTLEKPVNFTSANAYERLDVVGNGAQFADWGGIIINGFGITNQCTDAQRAATTCNVTTEGVTSYFGGNDNADNSGAIEFAKIWYAGSGPRSGGEGDDLNSLTLNAVGSASKFDYIHIHQGFDDGIEFFGGAASISHIAVTDTQDDAIDIDAGWQGSGQYIFVKHGTVETKQEVVIPAVIENGVVVEAERIFPIGSDVFMGNNGFETDGEKNGGAEYSEAPTSNPTFANVTVITTDGSSVRDDDPSQAFKFDDAIKSMYYNVLIVKTEGANGTNCIEHKSDGEINADSVSFSNSVMACVNEFKGEQSFISGKEPAALTGTAKADWFDNSAANVRIASTSSVLSNAFATDVDSADITITANDLSGLGSFFQAGNYIGAVSENDTSSDWYKWVEAAVTAADQD